MVAAPVLPVAKSLPERGALWGLISDLRLGVLAHNRGPAFNEAPFSRSKESGVDINAEILFVSPFPTINGLLGDLIPAPRPRIGFSVNTRGDTSMAYIGLTSEWEFWDNWFVGLGFGGAVHDGELTTARADKKAFGCRFLFHGTFEIGYRITDRHSLTAYLDHVSNGDICDPNLGLENSGMRYGYRF